MARPPNTDERRAQIATALLKVMAHHGYDGASIADIARAARIAPGAVHYHYRDKQEILLAALELLVREHSQRLMIALDAVGADPAAQLATFIDVHLGLGAHADPDALACWVLLAGEALRQRAVGTRFEAALVAIAHTLAEIIARGIATRAFRSDDPHAAAAALVATIQGYFVVAATARSLVPRGTAGACVARMAAGLLGVTAPTASAHAVAPARAAAPTSRSRSAAPAVPARVAPTPRARTSRARPVRS